MSIVRLPTCPICMWMMRQVRVSEGDQSPRVRVFECVRCHAEMIWTPEANQGEGLTRGKGGPFGWLP
jgi:hypothetical protein